MENKQPIPLNLQEDSPVARAQEIFGASVTPEQIQQIKDALPTQGNIEARRSMAGVDTPSQDATDRNRSEIWDAKARQVASDNGVFSVDDIHRQIASEESPQDFDDLGK